MIMGRERHSLFSTARPARPRPGQTSWVPRIASSQSCFVRLPYFLLGNMGQSKRFYHYRGWVRQLERFLHLLYEGINIDRRTLQGMFDRWWTWMFLPVYPVIYSTYRYLEAFVLCFHFNTCRDHSSMMSVTVSHGISQTAIIPVWRICIYVQHQYLI